MIFRIISIAFKGNKFRQDPKGFLGEEADGFLNSMFILPFIVPSLFIIFFFILGFTSLLSGPYGFFKFVFFITFIPFVIFASIIFRALKTIKRANKKVINETIVVKAEVKE